MFLRNLLKLEIVCCKSSSSLRSPDVLSTVLGSHAGGGWFAAGTALQDIIRASYHIERDWAGARGYMSFLLCFFFFWVDTAF